jgi:GR25 family glycosyltransferase involved in LPS biosynthesis
MKETLIIYSFICIISIFILVWSLYRNNFVEKFDMNENDFEYPNLYYINLEKRKDRKKHIEKQLKELDYPQNKINRIDAVYTSGNRTGCSISHNKALEEGLKQDGEYIIVLEDDFELIHDKEKTLDVLKNAVNTKDWNVIILACNGNSKKYTKYLNKVIDCQTRSGYIIKKTYIPILLKVWRETVNIRIKYNINKNNSYKNYNNKNTAGDNVWKKLQNDKWFTTNPILGKQMKSYSDIEEKVVDYKV